MRPLFQKVLGLLGMALAVCIALMTAAVPAMGTGLPVGKADCVQRQDFAEVLSHKFENHTLTITLSGERELCEPLNVLAALYEYASPSESWPQHLVGKSPVATIQKPGHISVTAPDGCGQRDWYAELGDKIPMPNDVLNGPGNPPEPHWVHDYSAGPKSYQFDGPGACVKPPAVKAEACCHDGKGSVAVEVTNPNAFQAEFHVMLGSMHQQVKVPAHGTKTVEFTDVANGTYDLTVKGLDKTVTKKVTVDCEQGAQVQVVFTDNCDGSITSTVKNLGSKGSFSLYWEAGSENGVAGTKELAPDESATFTTPAKPGMTAWWRKERASKGDTGPVRTWHQPENCTTPPASTPPPPPGTHMNPQPPAPVQNASVTPLASTGVDVGWLVPIAIALLAVGGITLLTLRRRHRGKATS